ncbi:alpha/beta fold hydrolase [Solicola gregarius]|uniref:Alpha/beta fold hydrolase n=1 Tax=Solicola gregarius TaxID=2908642 RepID=A0AA46TEJ1_9ACTN|nr:alpha/beta fold hydrolase [Solicola gregarius]UYM03606.1 alpha/beta fold hydrolase [Solicola gregarius]
MLLTLACALVVQGYTRQMFGEVEAEPRPAGDAESVPNEITNGGPIIDAADTQPRTLRPRRSTVALTFDDGPDPTWTPRILDVLEKHGVHATFFVTGTQAAEHPGLISRIVDEGHEIGVHTFVHADLGAIGPWRQSVELDETQLTVAGAADNTSTLLRPPYSSTNEAVDDAAWGAMRHAADEGYLTVLSTLDSEDWRTPGVSDIITNSTPDSRAGNVLLMHDGGGDRSQTVDALDKLLPQLAKDGYHVGDVSETTGLTGANRPATTADRWKGIAVIAAVHGSDIVLTVLSWFMIVAGVLAALRGLVLVWVARRHHRRSDRRWGDGIVGPVSIVVPAYNEAAGIEAAVRSLVASDLPVEVIVVDDGSTDDTAAIVESLGLPAVRLIRQVNAGKPAALNTGIAAATFDLVVMVDGDTVFQPDTVRELIRPFSDPRVGAVSGNAKVANRSGLLGRWQHIEYVVGFNLDRRMYDLAECMPTVPGAVGAFRRAALIEVGGVSDATLAEDTDLTMAFCRAGWRVVYEPDAVAWTEAPATLGALWRQRYRWSYGTMQAMWKHRSAMFQRGAGGRFGRRGLSYLLLFQVLLPLLAPAVDVFALYGLIFLDPVRVAGLWLGFLALQTGISMYAFRLDGERMRPLWTLALQQFAYRQLMYLVVIQSVWTAVAGIRLRWQRSERYGTLQQPSPDPARRSRRSRRHPTPSPRVGHLDESRKALKDCQMPSDERMTEYEHDGLRFDVRDNGPLDGAIVVLLHGFPQTSTSWEAVAADLNARGYRAIAPDQRGYSPGARPTGRRAYRTGALVADTRALITTLDAGPVHVVGHDWGAAVAWSLAAGNPELVSTLTTVSVPHPQAFVTSMLRSSQALRSYYMLLFQLPRLPETLVGPLTTMLRKSGMTDGQIERFRSEIVAGGALTGGLNWYRAMPFTSPGRMNVKVSVPTTHVWSDGDTALARRGAELTADHVTGPYRLEIMTGVSHWIPEHAPGALAEIIDARIQSA